MACLPWSTPFPTYVPLIRRETLDSIGGFDEALDGAQDRDLWLRLRARGEFGFTRELGVIKHNHEDQISTRLGLKRKALEYFLGKHAPSYLQEHRIHANQLVRLGLMQCAEGSRISGAQTLLRSMTVHPDAATLKHLIYQAFSTRRARNAHLEGAFRQLDGALRYF